MAEQTELAKQLVRQIEQTGPISFYTFMNAALYDPLLGYYMRDKDPFGRQGDFYTSPQVHSIFAETIARSVVEWWRSVGSPEPFFWTEYGAGRGELAASIIESKWARDDFEAGVFHYRIVEKSPWMKRRQQRILSGKDVEWLEDISGVRCGVVISNELIDAFPVHLIEEYAAGVREVLVGVKDGSFVDLLGPPLQGDLAAYWKRYGMPLEVGQRAEINLEGQHWLKNASQSIQQGLIVTVDYGDQSGSLYDESRMQGTIRAFKQHQVSSRLYENVGEQDLTADVNFSALKEYGEELGLQTLFYGTQSSFLMKSGILDELRVPTGKDPFSDPDYQRNMAIKQLIFPGGMGDRFQVLLQQRY